MAGWIPGCRTRGMEGQLWGLSIHGYWYLQQMLEPAPHRYWEMTVRGVWSSHLKLPFSQQTFLSIYSNPILWDADKQGTLPIIEELDISEEPDVERNTSGRKYVTLDVCVNCFGKQREHHLFYIGEHGKASQRGHWGWVYRVEEDRTLGRGNSVHLISVLGGMWQIMFTQGDKSFSLKKKSFKWIPGDPYKNVTCTHIWMNYLKQKSCQKYSWCNRTTTWPLFYWNGLRLWTSLCPVSEAKNMYRLGVFWLQVTSNPWTQFKKNKRGIDLKAFGSGDRGRWEWILRPAARTQLGFWMKWKHSKSCQ